MRCLCMNVGASNYRVFFRVKPIGSGFLNIMVYNRLLIIIKRHCHTIKNSNEANDGKIVK